MCLHAAPAHCAACSEINAARGVRRQERQIGRTTHCSGNPLLRRPTAAAAARAAAATGAEPLRPALSTPQQLVVWSATHSLVGSPAKAATTARRLESRQGQAGAMAIGVLRVLQRNHARIELLLACMRGSFVTPVPRACAAAEGGGGTNQEDALKTLPWPCGHPDSGCCTVDFIHAQCYQQSGGGTRPLRTMRMIPLPPVDRGAVTDVCRGARCGWVYRCACACMAASGHAALQ